MESNYERKTGKGVINRYEGACPFVSDCAFNNPSCLESKCGMYVRMVCLEVNNAEGFINDYIKDINLKQNG
jgi:hypothetical protein